MKKLTLDDIDITSEYLMLGISGHLKDYRMSFFLNQKLSLELIKIDNLEFLWSPRSEGASFSFYYFSNEEDVLDFYLLTNRSPAGILFPKIKNIDYLLLLKGLVHEVDEQEMIRKIREITNVLTVSKIDLSKMKEKDIQAVLSDIELHILTLKDN